MEVKGILWRKGGRGEMNREIKERKMWRGEMKQKEKLGWF